LRRWKEEGGRRREEEEDMCQCHPSWKGGREGQISRIRQKTRTAGRRMEEYKRESVRRDKSWAKRKKGRKGVWVFGDLAKPMQIKLGHSFTLFFLLDFVA
jgi:hypothetical protein